MRGVSLLLATGCVLAGCGKPEVEWVRADGKTTQKLEALHGSGPGDAWAVGAFGTVIHWDGTSWSAMDSGTNVDLHAVWAVGPGDAWAVGEQGVVLHWDGTRWTRVNAGTDKKLTGVWASGAADVWLAMSTAYPRGLLHFDGKTWSQRLLPDTSSGSPERVWGRGPDDVWVTMSSREPLMHWTGAGWSAERPEVGSYPECEDLVPGGAGELLALCSVTYLEKRVALRSASGWKTLPMDAGTLEAAEDWNGIWSAGSSLWAVGRYGRIHRFDGTAWVEELGEDLEAPDLRDVWGSSEEDVWAVGDDGLVVRRTPPASQ